MLDCCFALYLLSCLELQTGIEWFSSSPKPGLIEKLYTHSNICLLCVLKQIRVVHSFPAVQHTSYACLLISRPILLNREYLPHNVLTFAAGHDFTRQEEDALQGQTLLIIC